MGWLFPFHSRPRPGSGCGATARMERHLHLHVHEAYRLRGADPSGYSDPYVVVKMRTSTGQLLHPRDRDAGLRATCRGEVVPRTLYPVWSSSSFSLAFRDFTEYVVVSVYDRDRGMRDDFLGKVRIGLSELLRSPSIPARWYDLRDRRHEARVPGQVLVSLRASHMPPPPPPPPPPRVTLRIFAGTWNAGGATPTASAFRQWLACAGAASGPPPDLVVFGAQESSGRADWFSAADAALGVAYTRVASPSLREMRLSVHSRGGVPVHDVETHHVATGVGRVVGNKGAVAASLRVGGTTLCFVNSHLPAHQDRAARRAHSARAIVRGLRVGGARGMDALNQFHHVVWLGDLNSRLGYGGAGAAREPSPDDFGRAVSAIRAGALAGLAEGDQLAAESDAFHGFSEGDVSSFAPTFKLVPGSGGEYDPRRMPAWCDRVLWRSAPGHRLRQLAYASAPAVRDSDHTPVAALFEAAGVQREVAPAADPARGRCTLRVVGLRAELARGGGTAPPRLKVWAPFCVAPGARVAAGEEAAELVSRCNSPERLRNEFLSVRVASADGAPVAQAQVGLAALGAVPSPERLVWQSAAVPFACELTRGGRRAGTLRGTVQVFWEAREEEGGGAGRVEHRRISTAAGGLTTLTCVGGGGGLAARRRLSIQQLSANLLAPPSSVCEVRPRSAK